MFSDLFLIIVSYLLGSIPSGLILSKILKRNDPRTQGSGNIGATNAFRTGGKMLGGLTLLLDVMKGFAAVLLAKAFGAEYLALWGFICIAGHIFPVWLNFKGGKGVATAIGVIFGIDPMLAILTILLWLVVFSISRVSSLSALISLTVAFTIGCTLTKSYINLVFLLISLILLIFRHKDNIIRLYHGKENKIPK